jgi:dolichyl-phosphate-mannose-protein mannosyltransferase
MASSSARSTSALAQTQRVSLARRGPEYFGMSGPLEFILAAVLFTLLVALSIANVLHRDFNSDEPQHAHVIWGWTHGLVQYRDLFDNHMPLFHLLFAPLFALIGERATILFWMRFLLLPAYFVAAWCTYRIGTRLFSRRAGVWAVIAAGFYGTYHFFFFEFRTDNLWTAIWLLCVTVLVGGSITIRRWLVAGILLGLCFAVSMKSTLLLLAVLVNAPLAFALVDGKKLDKRWIYFLECAAVFLAAAVVVPVVIMIFFALKGVWRDFRYGVFDFNLAVQSDFESHPATALLIFAVAMSVVAYVARLIVRAAAADRDLAFCRAFLFLVSVFYFLALQILWPPMSRTFQPIRPLIFVLIAGALLALSNRLAHSKWTVWRSLRFVPLPAFVALVEFFLVLRAQAIWKDDTRNDTKLLRDVLVLTDPGDYILDAKGETIFRRRCSRAVLEHITTNAIERGTMIDDAPQRCIETHTAVVATINKQRFSPATRQFVERNYLLVTDDLRVAGLKLQASHENSHRYDFEVVIPASYKIISRDNNVSGVLDGKPYDVARFLEPGVHTFESESTSNELFLLWSQAVDRGFTPFGRNTLSDSD